MRPTNEEYSKMTKKLSPPSPKIKDFIWAFVVGGLICTVGQLLTELYKNFDNKKVKDIQFDITVTDEETRNIRILANIYEDIGKQVVIKKEE